MSAGYVRQLVRQWAGEIATATSIPYYETVNMSQNPSDPVWWSVTFNSEYHEGTFCEPGFIENGFVSVVIVAAPGTGDAAAISAIEQIVPAMMKKSDPATKLSLVEAEPINEDSAGSADSAYRVASVINYAYSL